MPGLLEIGLTFARLGLISFGGTNFAEMNRVLVTQLGWLTSLQLAQGLALGQLMPGPNLLAVTNYGYQVGGLPGALSATLGFYGPTALLATLVRLVWARHRQRPWVQAFRAALIPFGTGVLLAAAWVLGHATLSGWKTWLIATVALALLSRPRTNSALVVLGAGVAGALLGL